MKLVRYVEEGRITRIILNRPQKLNAFDADIIFDLTQALSKAEKSRARMVVFQGSGLRSQPAHLENFFDQFVT